MSSLSTVVTKPFRILDLPPEIRTKIYILLCTSPNPHISLSTPSSPFSEQVHPSFPHNLLLTNTQLYHELRPLYFTTNGFSLTIHRRNDEWSYFLSPSFLDNRRQIHSLRIVVTRWGSKDFFCKSLVPVLEDCVLHGKLRSLEVVVRESFLKGLGIVGTGGGFENWKSLKALLGDPYLESARLLAGSLGCGDGSETELTEFRDVTELIKTRDEPGNPVISYR
ncbi:hypothetical protein B2J93_4010 [Marssonina coronariae]|uniref:F-box domain-containing protein n=1 Tax=Diplocarpon coronariae TaxID=2795749 RepID=A0A218Z9S2_9HELO|nr:hypothetical protein B2J93_4010 [Marssonina coronariae]